MANASEGVRNKAKEGGWRRYIDKGWRCYGSMAGTVWTVRTGQKQETCMQYTTSC